MEQTTNSNENATLMHDIIAANFNQSIAVHQEAATSLPNAIANAATVILTAFNNQHKLLICGNGGSAADSQHFAAEFTGRYEIERQPLPALALTTDTSALTAIANDYNFNLIFAKQVQALGQSGDVLFVLSTSGNSVNIIEAIRVAHTRQMPVIALVGRDGGKIKDMLNSDDVLICVQTMRTARIQEIHILVLHTLCDIIDNVKFCHQ